MKPIGVLRAVNPLKLISVAAPLPTTLLRRDKGSLFYATKMALSVPGGDSGCFVSSQRFAIRQSEECSDCQTTAAGTDLYFGFFLHRGVTRLRRADTQAIKYPFQKFKIIRFTRGDRRL